VRLRAADFDDLAGIAAIYAPYVEKTAITFDLEPPSEAAWRSKWAAAQSEGHPWFVAESDDGELLGYVSTSPFMARLAYRSTIQTTIYLREDARGRGIGRSLYELALREVAPSFHVAVAGITLPNEASVALHERLGFTRAGVFEDVGHKLGQWRDVGWWQLRL
jgi:L-amino acid N-acyltransferase YncA